MSCRRKIAGSMTPGEIFGGGLPTTYKKAVPMKIKLIDFGVPEEQRPYRPHGNDAGADVYMPYDCTLQPGEIAKIPWGLGSKCRTGMPGMCFPAAAWQPRAGL